jgi:hypothetical protein
MTGTLAERWFAPSLQMWPLAARRCLVRNPINGASAELEAGEYAVLSTCDGCHTFEDHVALAAKQLSAPPEHRSAFRDLLQRCARQRLLMPLSDLIARLGAPAHSQPVGIAGVAIRTADRPALLARLLASAVKLEARSAVRRHWVVFDDSRDPANEEANRAAAKNCGALDVRFVGRPQSAAFVRELCREFPHAEREIDWLLGAGANGEATYGRPLNHALLFFAGRAFVAIDDDVVLDPRRPPIIEPGFAVDDAADELRWYDNDDALWSACPPLEIDPVAQHAEWLGLPLAAAWNRAERDAGALETIDLRPGHGKRLATDARVLFTHNHACGDPGSSLLPLQLLMLPRGSRHWVAANPGAAAAAFARRINWRGQTRLRLAPERVLTFTTMAGVDNTQLMPPAARSHRSEDVLLGIVAQWMHPSAWLVDLPFGLRHERESAKRWLLPTQSFMQEPLHVLYAWIDTQAPAIVAELPDQRLAAVGSLLRDLAAASDAHLREILRQHALEAGSRVLFAIAEQLDDATLPGEWKTMLSPWMKSPALAVDEASVDGRVLAPSALRTLARAYGSAMEVWSQLWNSRREKNR